MLILALAVRWGLWRSLRNRLLAMLHLGFVWLGVAFCLDAFTVGMRAQGVDIPTLLPLHALTMGFLERVLLAMVTRVSCGHSGRVLAADAMAWGLFWGLQLATLTRLTATLWPAQAESSVAGCGHAVAADAGRVERAPLALVWPTPSGWSTRLSAGAHPGAFCFGDGQTLGVPGMPV